MSRIYFHTRDEGTAELRGSERAYMGVRVTDLAAAFLPDFHQALEPWLGPYRRDDRGGWRRDDLAMKWFGYGPGSVPYRGGTVSGFDVALNTVITIGNEQLRLLARLHAQCEIHAYVEGPNRAWLADLIDAGRESGLYRSDQGWEDVAKLLRNSDEAPVVTSYSVTEQFPDPYIIDRSEWPAAAEDSEWFHELPDGERWDRSMAALRAQENREFELAPELLGRGFGESVTVFDVLDGAS